ncbi:MAG: glycosyltransferase family 2 protein [Campylobacteraceae bacterium]|nr:glycosyltransferase family 2 protein [Campylobacteraceae bacterium]
MNLNNPFTIVIPVYNEEDNLFDALTSLKNFLDKKGFKYEIVCVDDKSADKSGEILDNFEGIAVVHHHKNRGYGGALKSGIKNAKYDTIVIMDSDGQHSPEDLPKLLSAYDGEESMAIGQRKIYQTKASRVLGKILLHKIANFIFKEDILDINSGFRVFSKKIASKYVHLCSERFSFSTSITIAYISENLHIINVPIEIQKRAGGQSRVNFKTGFRTILKILELGMIFKPLRVILPISMLFAIVGLASFSVDLYNMNLTNTTVFLISNSVILFISALLAEQIKNIRMEIVRRD